MNIQVLKIFCDLVEMGSFSRAAENNYISQSAVSQQLAKLEQEFGVQLISRGGGFVEPTEAGRAFYNGAMEILRRYEQMLGEIHSAASSVRGVLRVGTIYSVGFYLLDPYIRKFIRAHTEVNLHVEYTRWSRIYNAVISGEMDLGVVAYPQKQRSIEVIPLTKEQLVVVCPPTHPLAKKKSVSPAELDGRKFVAFEENIPTRKNIDKRLKEEKVSVQISLAFDNIETVKRAVEVEAGLSILPKDNVEREAQRGDLVYVQFNQPEKWQRSIGIVRRRGKAPGPAEKEFLSLLRKKP